MMHDRACVATPHAELIAELMNPNNPKNEREHAAVREIERLRQALGHDLELPPPRMTGKFSVQGNILRCSGCTGKFLNTEAAENHSCKDYQ